MQRFAHLAQRLFNTPIAIHPDKAEVVMAALAERLGITKLSRMDGTVIEPMALESDEFTARGRERQAGYDLVAGVAIIEVSGTLVHKLGTMRPYSGMTGYDGIRANLLVALEDPAVQAIVLDIDSPGGEVSGCFDLVDTIRAARGSKPIWAILSECAYSAAYAIASACDRITVPRTGGVGSIGVVWMHMDFAKAIDEAGMKVTFITFGDRKVDGNMYQALPDDVRERIQKDIDVMGELFVSTVSSNLGIDAEKIRGTQAATFLGADGVALGLAHAVMSPDAAFQALLETLAE